MGEPIYSTAVSGCRALDLEGLDVPAGPAVSHTYAPPLAPGQAHGQAVAPSAGRPGRGAVLPGSHGRRSHVVGAVVASAAGFGPGGEASDPAHRPSGAVGGSANIGGAGRHLHAGALPGAVRCDAHPGCRDLRWLQERCDKVAIVAHSQGAAIAHQVLKDGYQPANLQAFITLGQGITKLHLLQRMDWDPRVSRAAWWSRLLVTTGMFFAGLPALGLLARHWTSTPVVKALTSMPVSIILISAGFVCIAAGIMAAVHAVCGDLEEDLALPEARFSWSDYYASADPVSNGPLIDRARRHQTWLLPGSCNQVYNSASIIFDHNRYLHNQDQLLSRLLNDLAAAAYGDSQAKTQIVRDDDLIKVGRRRHRLILGLVACRILAVGLAAELWLVNIGPLLKGLMNQLVHLFAPHMGMDDGLARLLAAVLTTAAAYIAVIIVWRTVEIYVVRRFFHTAERLGGTALREDLHEPAHDTVVKEISAVG